MEIVYGLEAEGLYVRESVHGRIRAIAWLAVVWGQNYILFRVRH